ncbi:MAG: hypothetical protein ACFFDU_09635 [Candidatus Thorarchaeota archaeon]
MQQNSLLTSLQPNLYLNYYYTSIYILGVFECKHHGWAYANLWPPKMLVAVKVLVFLAWDTAVFLVMTLAVTYCS